MFIVHGKTIVRKQVGFIGHFCPACRGLALFKATNLREVDHLYLIPIGRGRPIATECVCQECGTMLGMSYGAGNPESASDADLVAFAARTSPWGIDGLVTRQSLEERALAGNISAEERSQLIIEPFEALEYFARVERARGSDQSVTAVISLLAISGLVASALMVFSCLDRIPPTRQFVAWTIGVCATTAALLAWTVQRIVTDRKRVARSRKVLEPLARSLRQLRPRSEEIEEALSVLRSRQSMFGASLTAQQVLTAIDGLP